jgi:hypothetical protein
LKFHLLESFPLAAVSTRRRGFLVGLATTRAGHDAGSGAPAGRFPFSTLVAQRGSTVFSVFSIYPLSIVDFMRVLMVAGSFYVFTFPPHSSFTLVASRTVRASKLITPMLLLHRPPFLRSRLRLHLLPSVCFRNREKQKPPANRSKTRK